MAKSRGHFATQMLHSLQSRVICHALVAVRGASPPHMFSLRSSSSLRETGHAQAQFPPNFHKHICSKATVFESRRSFVLPAQSQSSVSTGRFLLGNQKQLIPLPAVPWIFENGSSVGSQQSHRPVNVSHDLSSRTCTRPLETWEEVELHRPKASDGGV